MGVNPRAPHAMALSSRFRLSLFPESEVDAAEVARHVTCLARVMRAPAWGHVTAALRGVESQKGERAGVCG